MSWPIESLTIHRFRGIEDLTLEGMGRINLLVGDNNSGKTSILEAMSVYCKPLDTFAWIDTARRRVRGFRQLSIIDAMKWLFPHGKQASGDGEELFSGDIAVSGRGQAGARTARARFEEFEEIGIIDQPGEAGPSEERLERGATLNLTATTAEGVEVRGVRLLERMLRRTRPEQEKSLSVEIISPFDHGVEELYSGLFRRAVVGGYKGEVVEALRRIDPGIEDMEFLPSSSTHLSLRSSGSALYLRHTRSGRTPLSAFGDGIRRVLLLALTLPSASGGALLIDEIETAIHISVLSDVFAWLVDSCHRNNVQLFATTHSLEALDAILAASKDQLGEIVGYHCRAREHGGSPKRYDGEQLHRLRYERGLDVR
jgi:hypothetical protein